MCEMRKVTQQINPKPKRETHNTIERIAKERFVKFYGLEGLTRKELNKRLADYEGFDITNDLDRAAQIFERSFYIYSCTPVFTADDVPEFEMIKQVIFEGSDKQTHFLQFPTEGGGFHVSEILEPENLTGIEICPFCGIETFDRNSDRKKYHNRNRFLKHKKECEKNGGKLVSDVKLQNTQRPYAPHFDKQPVYEFLFAHGLEHKFRPTDSFITFDFETVENEAKQLTPLMVSYTTTVNSVMTDTFNFNIRDNGDDFVTDWIAHMFKSADTIAQVKYDNYFKDDNFAREVDKLTPKQQHYIMNKLRYEMCNVSVIGFNSAKFDLNLFIKSLNERNWRITSILGTTTSHKQVLVKRNDRFGYDLSATLRFVDIRQFIAGGTLDQFTQDFGDVETRVKGFFPYEHITVSNWNVELSKSEPFEQYNFFSSLSDSSISDVDYQTYLESAKPFESRFDYFVHYCNVDVEIMVHPIINLINIIFDHKVDMLHNLSLSSNASMIRYSKLYNDFDISMTYPSKFVEIGDRFDLTLSVWNHMTFSYLTQDKRAGRDVSTNVSKRDCQHFRRLFKYHSCVLCGEWFTNENKPSLDRLDNNLPHTVANVQATCRYCNVYKSNNDEQLTKLRLNLRKYALARNLPMTLSIDDKDAYHIIRKGITGGLSNVQHRINLKGVTRINKFSYDVDENIIMDTDTNNVMTHFVGVDFNSLYPSTFASVKHDFVPYTDGKMYMPGRLKSFIKTGSLKLKNEARKIISGKCELFIVEVKGHIPSERMADVVNFPPIFRNITITTDESTIGSFMYDYCKQHNFPTDKKTRKLTQLFNTNGEYMSFSSYYLWYLIDRFGFIIDDIKSIMIFTKTDGFNSFATEFMNERQKAELAGNKGKSLFCKTALNGSYGYDALNTAKYHKNTVCSKSRAQCWVQSQRFRDVYDLGNDAYLVSLENNKYNCNTCLHCAFFNLDNAKFWYLVFIYDFMYRCLDMHRLHFIEGDTDSMYWAVAGDPSLPNTQTFQAIITDKAFYDEHVFKFAPYNFYVGDETKRPIVTTPAERKAHEKKLMGLAIEKQGDNMVALSPKCYTCFNEETKAVRCKGLNTKQNKLSHQDYCDVLFNDKIVRGVNKGFQCKDGVMTRVFTTKIGLSGVHTKGVTQANGAVHPFVRS